MTSKGISRALCGTPGLYAVKEDYAEFAVGAEFWKLGQCEKVKFLNKVSDLPLHPNQRKQDPLEPIGDLPFLPSEVSALKTKVARILDGNIRVGFSGPKSRIVCSYAGEQPHLVSAVSITSTNVMPLAFSSEQGKFAHIHLQLHQTTKIYRSLLMFIVVKTSLRTSQQLPLLEETSLQVVNLGMFQG